MPTKSDGHRLTAPDPLPREVRKLGRGRISKNGRVDDFEEACASGTSARSAGLRYLWLLKSPFLLRQLMLQPTMDTLGR
jgi:hypothetical protein